MNAICLRARYCISGPYSEITSGVGVWGSCFLQSKAWEQVIRETHGTAVGGTWAMWLTITDKQTNPGKEWRRPPWRRWL